MIRDCQVETEVLTSRDFDAARPGACRRREPRVRVDRAIVVIPFGFRTGLQFKPARLVDCSRRGVGLVTIDPLLSGELFMVKANLRQFVLLLYTVRHCARLQDHGYRVGGEFSGIIGPGDERDPSDVLDALLEGNGWECRSEARSI